MRTPILLLVLVASCTCLSISTWGESFATEATPPIKLGFIAPLTGPFATWGESIQRGAQLALEDAHHKFEIDYQDDSCEPQKALTIAQKFFSTNEIKMIIGPGCVDGLEAIAPIAEHKNALLFSTGLLDDKIFQNHHTVINLATQISVEAKYLAAYIAQGPAKHVAIIHGTNKFGEEFGLRLPGFLNEHGVQVTANEATDLNSVDFKPEILRIMHSKPDAIFIHQGEAQIVAFMKQLRGMGFTLPVYSYYAIETESVLNGGGTAIESLQYSFPVNPNEGAPSKTKFDQRFKEKFGPNSFPSATSYYVYDGLLLLDKALNSCKPTDTKCILNFFKNVGSYTGLSGQMTFGNDGSNLRPYGLKQVSGGRFVWVSKDARFR